MTKYIRFIAIGSAFIFLISIFLVVYHGRGKNTEQNNSFPNVRETQQQWETKIDDRPPVAVKVTPIELGMGKGVQAWKFAIVLDTHSGSLNQDPTQIATLVDDKGKVYKPTAWNGAGPGGHHREGILTFDPIDPFPQSVELKIKGLGGVPERSFKWNIK